MPENSIDPGPVLLEFSRTPCTGNFCTTTRCSCSEYAMAEEVTRLRREVASLRKTLPDIRGTGRNEPRNMDEYRHATGGQGSFGPVEF